MSAEHAVSQLSSETLHASCVAIDGHAVLIEGPSGAGKSDLTLRLIDRGAVLVSDDYTLLLRRDGVLYAAAPQTIRGQIEVRGIGVVELPCIAEAPVAAVIVIDPNPERMPERDSVRPIAGIAVPQFALPALEPSAPIKVELVVRRLLATRA
ncbi:HPr kinase/phosphorylase [Sphingomonas qomolangmaensis]|uniref:HPr kinase/phosphatase C-terminal domain-containing protein n=1 Tax=Sphingomonas qomolangmaensis TaxID=2918765 RepID=A0ABY5L988_9SPHN|nr:HPr kinase/phosphatase C-terminal domain-containing protein [Sphingomonas qomolangmaensis]UUL83510.1 HPr kinase/phosphatase C-terminal domain-containing protein [Sphingomonas qomolangmaensis]